MPFKRITKGMKLTRSVSVNKAYIYITETLIREYFSNNGTIENRKRVSIFYDESNKLLGLQPTNDKDISYTISGGSNSGYKITIKKNKDERFIPSGKYNVVWNNKHKMLIGAKIEKSE